VGDSVVAALSVLALYDEIVFWGFEIMRWLPGFPLIGLRKGLRVGRVAAKKITGLACFFFLGCGMSQPSGLTSLFFSFFKGIHS
jgi:hypothetical protein